MNSIDSLVITISIILVALSVTWAIMANKRLDGPVDDGTVNCKHNLEKSSMEHEISSEGKTDFTGEISAIEEEASSRSDLTMSDPM